MSKPSIPDTIPCEQQFICPVTGGAIHCEPRLESVDEALGYATYRHQCAYGWEAVDLLDLLDPLAEGDGLEGDLAVLRRWFGERRDAILDAALSAVLYKIVADADSGKIPFVSCRRAVLDAMLADAAASTVARDEVVGEIVEEEERWS